MYIVMNNELISLSIFFFFLNWKETYLQLGILC